MLELLILYPKEGYFFFCRIWNRKL